MNGLIFTNSDNIIIRILLDGTNGKYLSAYNETGTVYEERLFGPDKLVVSSKKYYTSGIVKETCEYSSGVLAERRTFRPNGTCSNIFRFDCGVWRKTTYDNIGKLDEERHYIDGILTGEYTKYYSNDTNIVELYDMGIKVEKSEIHSIY